MTSPADKIVKRAEGIKAWNEHLSKSDNPMITVEQADWLTFPRSAARCSEVNKMSVLMLHTYDGASLSITLGPADFLQS